MSMKQAKQEEPILQYLAHKINEWLEAQPSRTQLEFAQLVKLDDGTHPSRPTISNLLAGKQGASIAMVQAVAAALGLSIEQLARESGPWWEAQKKEREAVAHARGARVTQRSCLTCRLGNFSCARLLDLPLVSC